MYKVIKLIGKQIEEYKGTIVAVLESVDHKYAVCDEEKGWHLTCLVKEDDPKPEDNLDYPGKPNNPFFDFKIDVCNYFNKYNNAVRKQSLIFGDNGGTSFNCEFVFDEHNYILKFYPSAKEYKWKLFVSTYRDGYLLSSMGTTIEQCCEKLFIQ